MIKTEKLNLFYDRKNVASNINFSASQSELCCIIGRNGAGKSSFIKALGGINGNYDGKIFICGNSLKNYSPIDLAKKLSLVLTENLGEINFLTVFETVQMGRYPYINNFAKLSKQDYNIVEEALETVGLQDLKKRTLSQLSDGQRQKVLIAKTLAQNTDVICLDEPLSFLDLPTKIDILELLLKIAKNANKKCVVLSIHDLELAFEFSDYLFVFGHNGENYQLKTSLKDKKSLLNDIFPDCGDILKKIILH